MPDAAALGALQMYQVTVPTGVQPGEPFQAVLGGRLMLVTCPEGAMAGSTIQLAAPANTQPVTGVPVDSGLAGSAPLAQGVAVDGVAVDAGTHVEMVEVEEISPAGWFCLIVGCIACPPFNLLGLCMRQRRLVPITVLHDGGWAGHPHPHVWGRPPMYA